MFLECGLDEVMGGFAAEKLKLASCEFRYAGLYDWGAAAPPAPVRTEAYDDLR